jgi:pyruvate formate lyase activating enzyme
MGEEIAGIDPDVQVTVLDYRPQFRRMDLVRPTVEEMREVGRLLRTAGLTTVVCQTRAGHVGPI